MAIIYHSDNSISVDINFSDLIDSLHRTDFDIMRISGDDLWQMQYWLTGSGMTYKLWFLPEKNKEGSFSIDFTGNVSRNGVQLSVTAINALDASLDLDSATAGIQTSVIIFYNTKELEVDWIIPKGTQNREFTIAARFSKYLTNPDTSTYNSISAYLETKILLFGAPKGTTVTITPVSANPRKEFEIKVNSTGDAEIVPSFDLEELATSQIPTPILERITSEHELEEGGQREIRFTFTGGIPTLVGRTEGIVKFYSDEDSTGTITSTPGSTGTFSSGGVVFNQDGTAVATINLTGFSVTANTTIYAEIEITIDSETYSTGRFKIIITSA